MLVRIFIVGLVAFVNQGDDVVLLVRESEAVAGADVEPHVATLWWDAECKGDCDGFGRSKEFKRPKAGNLSVIETGFWILDGDELQIKSSYNAMPSSIGHIVEMAEIATKGETAQPKAELLSMLPPNAPLPTPLSARWKIEGARVEACHLATFCRGAANPGQGRCGRGVEKVAKVSFHRGGSKKREGKAVADVGLVELKSNGGYFELTRVAQGTGNSKTIRLEPKKADSAITLVLSNQPPQTSRDASSPSYHFDNFYGLSKRPPSWKTRRRIPHVSGYFSTVFSPFVGTCKGKYENDPLLHRVLLGYTPWDKVWKLRDGVVSLGNRPMCPAVGY